MRVFLTVLAGLLTASLSYPAVAADFTTPESAIRTLEAAYIAEDIEAAVAARDFQEEARLMFVDMLSCPRIQS